MFVMNMMNKLQFVLNSGQCFNSSYKLDLNYACNCFQCHYISNVYGMSLKKSVDLLSVWFYHFVCLSFFEFVLEFAMCVIYFYSSCVYLKTIYFKHCMVSHTTSNFIWNADVSKGLDDIPQTIFTRYLGIILVGN